MTIGMTTTKISTTITTIENRRAHLASPTSLRAFQAFRPSQLSSASALFSVRAEPAKSFLAV